MKAIGGSHGRTRRPPLHLLASLLLHALVLAGVLYHHAPWIAPMRLPGTAHGSRLELTYSPGRAPVRTSIPHPRSTPQVAAAASTPQPSPTRTALKASPASPNSTSPSTSQPDSVAGADALGDGNISIALAAFFPTPKPNLSALARGSVGDVILDIVIDSTGRIADIKLTSGLGHGVDETVIATVQQWTFHPATKDGQPIASEQELRFHYEKS